MRFGGCGSSPETATFDQVLISIGRRPTTGGLGLDNTAVEIGEDGFIVTNAQLRTADASIFAIGDVVGQPMLAHKASHEGRTAAEVFFGQATHVYRPRRN